MEKAIALNLLMEELIEARKRASWYVAAMVIKGSLAEAGIDEPPTSSELDDLRATLTSLRSLCEDAQILLKE
ncbi:hypothetical protein D9O50_01625 [Oxalobacteraceae bacterium CAVE-383]|nr:hypothetical protein D9O50_01625 [Oxalobacteraceae bacterium CAVE-383]